MKYFMLFITTIFLSTTAFSQDNFTEGSITDLSEKSIKGQIDYRNWEKNPKTISFKANNQGETEVLNPSTIKGFSIPSDNYTSAIVDVKTKSDNPYADKKDKQYQLVKDTVFLQNIVSGPKSLYYLQAKDGESYFYIKKGNEIVYIPYHKYTEGSEGVQLIKEDKEFVNILTIYFSDSEETLSKLEDIEYGKKSLFKLFQTYYNSKNQTPEYLKTPEKMGIRFGIMAGGALSTLKFKEGRPQNLHSQLLAADFSPSLFPTGGLYFDLVFPRNLKKWSFSSDIGMNFTKFNSFNTVTNSDVDYYNEGITIKFLQMKLNTLLKYRVLDGKFSLFLKAGFFNAFALINDSAFEKEKWFYSDYTKESSPLFNNPRKHENGLTFGVETNYKNLGLEVRMEAGNGMSPIKIINSNLVRYSLLLNYNIVSSKNLKN